MIRRSLVQRCGVGQELYQKGASALPREFYEMCSKHLKILQHQPTFIGVRSSQVRGLFLASNHPTGIESNQPIFTIPLTSVQTVSNITSHPFALNRVTLDNVRDAIYSDEFRMMAPQLFLGLQVASIVSHVPKIKHMVSDVELRAAHDVLVQDIVPWARMLDDEDFNEEFIFGMYGMALDTWQRNTYQELTQLFHRNISEIHNVLKLPFSIDLFRRMTRLVLARAEHVPLTSVYEGPRWMRRLRRAWRVVQRDTQLPSEVGVAPLLDLVNHSNRPNVGIRIGPSSYLGGKPAVTVHSISKIRPGQELCRHYNFALSRPNALFRYGFLPFDLISVIENDAIHEHIVKNQDMFAPEAPEVVEKKKKEMDEIARLERLFREARSKKPTPSSSSDAPPR